MFIIINSETLTEKDIETLKSLFGTASETLPIPENPAVPAKKPLPPTTRFGWEPGPTEREVLAKWSRREISTGVAADELGFTSKCSVYYWAEKLGFQRCVDAIPSVYMQKVEMIQTKRAGKKQAA